MGPLILKCVIWDLDETIWAGILVEEDSITVRPEAFDLIKRLDAAGIVQSIVSKNDSVEALRMLSTLGLTEYFVYPQISWSAKSASVARIVECLDVGADTVVLVDDSAFERAEVTAKWPEIQCFALPEFLDLDRREGLVTGYLTDDSARRPRFYREESLRRAAEEAFGGTSIEFLSTLDMVLTIREAVVDDFPRAVELTRRTNQLNTTGIVLSVEQLAHLVADPTKIVIIAELTDRFGSYGSIGLCLASRQPDCFFMDLLLMSCRVAGRNVSRAFVGAIGVLAASIGLPLRSRYQATGRNRQMHITYAFLGFTRVPTSVDDIIFEHLAPGGITIPSYIDVRCAIPLASSSESPETDVVQRGRG